MRAVLTRRGDYFVDPSKRSEIARKAKADLLVSVHADSFPQLDSSRRLGLRVLSTNRANREMGSWLGSRRSRGSCWGRWARYWPSLIPTPIWRRPSWILSMDKSAAEDTTSAARSCTLARPGGRLPVKAPEHASLAVLKAPDILGTGGDGLYLEPRRGEAGHRQLSGSVGPGHLRGIRTITAATRPRGP